MWVCGKFDKKREWFLPNTDNILVFFIVFEWGRISESAVDKEEVKRNEKLRFNYFSVNVSILPVVFRQQIKKAQQFWVKLLGFFNLSVKCNS